MKPEADKAAERTSMVQSDPSRVAPYASAFPNQVPEKTAADRGQEALPATPELTTADVRALLPPHLSFFTGLLEEAGWYEQTEEAP